MRFQQRLGQLVVPVLLVAAVAAVAWHVYQRDDGLKLPPSVASGNGRIEATEYDIATIYAGRLQQVLAEEGQMVDKDQVLARIDTESLDAELREANAGLREARDTREYAQAIVSVRESELRYAQREVERSRKLAKSGHISQEQLDQSNTNLETATAALKAARIQVTQAESGIEAAEARISRLQTQIDESRLTAPIRGRVLYKLAQTGEVLGAGGKVMTMLDLSDVYMTIFLPTEQAGKVHIGGEARIILDAVPQYVIPAKVSFVAPRTQFTPKAVETRTEREKLMFRVKVHIDPQLLKDHIEAVKTGVPGEAYILLPPAQEWPDALKVNLPG
ncbi:MAG: HlyD family efflux transporter periplasmic adaptor subunit [Nevskiales bacterium]|nr:HlyD family efflux transporter periplasmic adaptor subunit [Nevskiales bacterium]